MARFAMGPKGVDASIPKEQFNRLGRPCRLAWTSTPGLFSVGRALPPRDLIDSFEPEVSSGRPSFVPMWFCKGRNKAQQ